MGYGGRRPIINDETTRAIIRGRARQGETYRVIGLAYGVSEGTIARIVGPRAKLGRRTLVRACFGCGSGSTRRFYLAVRDPSRRSSRGAGSLDLCEPCWRKATRRVPRALTHVVQ